QMRNTFHGLTAAIEGVAQTMLGLRLNGAEAFDGRIIQQSSPPYFSLGEIAAELDKVAVPHTAEEHRLAIPGGRCDSTCFSVRGQRGFPVRLHASHPTEAQPRR